MNVGRMSGAVLNRLRDLVLVSALGLCVLGASGCGADVQQGGRASTRVADKAGAVLDIPPTLQPKELPLQAYKNSPREDAMLDYAMKVLMVKCMTVNGFDAQAPKFDDLADYYDRRRQLDDAAMFGLTDRGSARKYGYAEPPGNEPPVWEIDTSTAAARLALDGERTKPWTGCAGKAQMRLYDTKTDITQSPLPQRLGIDAYQRAKARADWVAAYADFGLCLREAGYDVPDPEKPFGSKELSNISMNALERESGADVVVPKAEIKLALADVDCKVKADLVRRLEKILAEEQTELIESNALALAEDEKKTTATLKRAADVMAGKDIK